MIKSSPKERMVNWQLSEWLNKGKGLFKIDGEILSCCGFSVKIETANFLVDNEIKIRYWDSEEWIEPTVDIWERDCK